VEVFFCYLVSLKHLPFWSVINWLYKLHGLVASFLQLPHPPFHSNASSLAMYFCSVALQSEFRRRWEFHHVIGVHSCCGSHPVARGTEERPKILFGSQKCSVTCLRRGIETDTCVWLGQAVINYGIIRYRSRSMHCWFLPSQCVIALLAAAAQALVLTWLHNSITLPNQTVQVIMDPPDTGSSYSTNKF